MLASSAARNKSWMARNDQDHDQKSATSAELTSCWLASRTGSVLDAAQRIQWSTFYLLHDNTIGDENIFALSMEPTYGLTTPTPANSSGTLSFPSSLFLSSPTLGCDRPHPNPRASSLHALPSFPKFIRRRLSLPILSNANATNSRAGLVQ